MVAGLGIEVKGIRGRSGSDVAMNDALGVGRIQGVSDLDAEFEDAIKFHGAIADSVIGK